ncbi:jg4420 [Pararge aegeria aegeria]|uniref:Jg4420 protein n=1 Tax=Pararge aegeria aegeria TaxID=348720 RepID=A0A8S4S019_9NEOP|nr:jg4420 [Pararge aegeria aegeria]
MQDNGFWRIRFNHKLFKEPNAVKTIKLLRMQWAGHVQRMEGTRAPKRLMEGTLEGRRRRGRPRVVGVRSWKEAASERLKWRNCKAHPGLQSFDDDDVT